MKKSLLYMFSILFLINLQLSGQEEDAQPGCTDCHSDLVSQEVMHYPAEDDCENCHMPNGNEHPQDGVSGFDLGDEMPGLCFLCHEEHTKENKHIPVEMGECLMCHSAHGSPNKGLLLQAPESAICGECHDMSMTEMRVKHGPISGGTCSSCHDPHQSDHSALLKSEKPGLCIQCHTMESLMEENANQHYPFEDDCANCHVPHSSEQDYLLNDEVPGLCFLCHEEYTKEMKHAPAEMGECLMCHSAHASPNKGLLLQAPESVMCGDCHDMSMTEQRVKHGPIGEGSCSGCHDPHQSDQSMLLKSEKPGLCMQCHTKASLEGGMANQHYPFEDDCANCHTTHSSEQDHLLNEKMPDLCYMCHDSEPFLDTTKVIHKVVTEGKGCSNCHSPHASDQMMLLTKEGKALCLECHSEAIETEERTLANIGESLKEGNFIHGVIEMDGCTTCHAPHSSENPLLLNGTFPTSTYTEALAENFDLCFTCHDAELMTSETTDYATNFRDGDQNMHFLHINGTKGRNCNLCHDMHGSPNEHLIAESVMFGNWDMPVEFKVDENGGSCLTGCHAEKAYTRLP